MIDLLHELLESTPGSRALQKAQAAQRLYHEAVTVCYLKAWPLSSVRVEIRDKTTHKRRSSHECHGLVFDGERWRMAWLKSQHPRHEPSGKSYLRLEGERPRVCCVKVKERDAYLIPIYSWSPIRFALQTGERMEFQREFGDHPRAIRATGAPTTLQRLGEVMP